MKSGFITLIGRPNVGKSTLLNRFVGQKVAIVSDKPQTTRNRIMGIVTTDQLQAVFIDTPGIHKPHHKLGEYMTRVAADTLREVDLVLYVADVAQRPGAGEEYLLEQLRSVKTPLVLVLNKIDLLPREEILPQIAWFSGRGSFAEMIPVSARSGENMDDLLGTITSLLPEGPAYYPEDMVTDQPESFVAGEIIREKVLQLTREEVPHSVAVTIDEMGVRPNEVLYLRAYIYVERASQKGIIIGRGGRMLKEIGSRGRQELEAIFGNRVYLELLVKVKKDWRDDDSALHRFGYE